MKTTRICPSCRSPLPADAPNGLCPRCLLEAESASKHTAGTPSATSAQAPPPTPAELAPLFPQLEIIEFIGQGGMGIVYKARQQHLDRFVALKILIPEVGRDPAFAERFLREARALARLNHPNIVAVHDFGQAGQFFYLIMEFVDGVNLRQFEQSRRLTAQEALSIVPKICEALQFAHDEGIVHRDIKPGNILVDQRGKVKIADFGLAKLVGQKADPTLTQSRQVLGTPAYMAPEQIERPTDVDHRADIYSLGVVFYEMLTGELPIGRFSPPSQKVRVDVRLDDVVLKSLEKEPERRYQTARAVKSDVETISTAELQGKPDVVPGNFAEDPLAPAELERSIRNAAFAVSLSAALNIAAGPIALILMWMVSPGDLSSRSALVAWACLPAFLGYLFILRSAEAMRQMESHKLATAGAIILLASTIGDWIGLATLGSPDITILTPGNLIGMALGKRLVFPGHLIGIPAALWALVVLNKPQVKRAFAEKAAQLSKETSGLDAAKAADSLPPLHRACLEWWAGRSLAFATAIKWSLIIAYVIGVLCFVTTNFQVNYSSPGSLPNYRNTIGQPAPWFVIEKKSSGFEYAMVLSSAWLMAALAAVALYGYGLIRRAQGTFQKWQYEFLRWTPIALSLIAIMAAMRSAFASPEGPADSPRTRASSTSPSPELALSPFSTEEARQHQERWARHLNLPAISTNSIGMALCVIPPGEFDMGSRAEDMSLLALPSQDWFFREWATDRIQNEAPRHRVKISRPFLLGQHEVTVREFRDFIQATNYRTEAEKGSGYGWSNGEWEEVAGFNWRNPGFPQTDEQPVGNLSWNDAAAFCSWLSEKEKAKYRLPTEAEWEFACRAGTITWYSTGERDQSLQLAANIADAALREKFPAIEWAAAWSDEFPFTSPVGRFQANPFRLHDMHGNVWEWCSDWYDAEYYKHSATVDPTGPTNPPREQFYHVFRGGGWDNYAGFCRSADRYSSHSPTLRTEWAGFRVVREVAVPSEKQN